MRTRDRTLTDALRDEPGSADVARTTREDDNRGPGLLERPAVRVVIADDLRPIREALLTLFELTSGMEVIGLAADGSEAVAARHLDPDIVLMEPTMLASQGAVTSKRSPGSR
jgi:hypothetical protein